MTKDVINENKIYLNKKDKSRGGKTLLHLLANDPQDSINNHATRSYKKGDKRNVTRYTDKVYNIVKAGADIDILDDEGNTPLDYAIESAVRYSDNTNIKTFLNTYNSVFIINKLHLLKGMDRCLELLHLHNKDDNIIRTMLQVGNMILNKLKMTSVSYSKIQKYEKQIQDIQLKRMKNLTKRSIVYRGLKRSKKVKSKVAIHEKKTTESEDCPVCLDKLYDIKQGCVTLTSCSHSLHKKCLRELVVNMKIKLCPVCKAPINKVRPCSTFNVYDIKKDGVITKSKTRSIRRKKL
jgi:hypothetical protein